MQKYRKVILVAVVLGVSSLLGFWLLSKSLFGLRMMGTTGGSSSVGSAGSAFGIMNPAIESLPMAEDMIGRRAPSSRAYRPPVVQNPDDALDVDERVYERRSNFSVVHDDVTGYLRQFKEYVLSIDGRVLNTSLDTNQKFSYGYVQVRVPVERFDEVNLRVVEGVQEVVREGTQSIDRTGSVVSVVDQIAEMEEELVALEVELEEATDETERRRLELQIERLEQRIAALQEQQEQVEGRVSYAAVTVQVADDIAYFVPNAQSDNLWEETQEAWEQVVVILLVIARLMIWLLVFSVLWLPVVLVVWWLGRRFIGGGGE